MSMSITVPKEYGYVLLTAASTTVVASWIGFRVGIFRKATRIIKYPQRYAEQSQIAEASPEQKQRLYQYNCAQRAHGNFVEWHPSVVIAMMIGGLKFPVLSAGLGAAWTFSRFLYTVGYTNASKPNGKGRQIGLVFIPLQSVLFLVACYAGVQFVLQ
ncbi:MAG: hypothetical protein M1820_001686 [Bogoriella megaspora]|nr:MAG: hypothetical protein M1820_001686 [Bogoriella megaspora]